MTVGRLMLRTDLSRDAEHSIALLLQRDQTRSLLPAADTPLAAGDRVLFCGRASARRAMRRLVISYALPAPIAAAPPEAARAVLH